MSQLTTPRIRYSFRGLRHIPLRKQRFALLFSFLLISIVVYPYAESSTLGYFAFRVLGSAVIILTVYALALRRGLVLALLVLAVPTMLHRFLLTPSSNGTAALVARLLSLSFDVVVIVIIFRCIFAEQVPSTETIFGALCVYLLLGYAFASVYGLILSLEPTAFYLDPTLNRHATPDRFDLVYFSFGTMTELGTPGITALSREVRSVSILQAVIGILYLAVLISRLISAYRPVVESDSTAHIPQQRSASNFHT